MFRAPLAAGALVLAATALGAQSTAAYRARVDSLALIWRPLHVAEQTSAAARRTLPLPPDSVRVGDVVVRPESAYLSLARKTAERFAPRLHAAYGAFGAELARHPFVIYKQPMKTSPEAIATGVADSLGTVTQRSSVFVDVNALESSWAQKAEQVVTDALDPSVRAWIGAVVPIDSLTKATMNRARIELLFSNATVARRCVNGDIERCMVALELVPSEHPAYDYLSAEQRRDLVINNARIIRRADPTRFDRCADAQAFAACDSLIAMIPSDAVPRPVPPSVRQSLVQFALSSGGPGAFDRFAAASSMKARLEAASRLRTDSLVRAWHASLFESRSASTALDGTTAASSLFWICVCAALALRSSRWR